MSNPLQPNVARLRMGRQACDRCHDQKLRCTPDESAPGRPCARCHRLKAICSHASAARKLSLQDVARRKRSISSEDSHRRDSRTTLAGHEVNAATLGGNGEETPGQEHAQSTAPWTGMMNTPMQSNGNVESPFYFGNVAPPTTNFWPGSTVANQAGSSLNPYNVSATDRLNFLSAENAQFVYQTPPEDNDNFVDYSQYPNSNATDHSGSQPSGNPQPTFGLEYSSSFNVQQAQEQEAPPAAQNFPSFDDAHSSRDLFRLSTAIEDGRKQIDGNAPIPSKSEALIAPCRQFVIALHCLRNARSNLDRTSRPQHQPGTVGSSGDKEESATALLVLSCYTSLLLLLNRFMEILESQHREAGFPFHWNSGGGQWNPATSPFSPPTQSELNNAWHAQIVSHMFDSARESLYSFMTQYMEVPSQNNGVLTGHPAPLDRRTSASSASSLQRRQKRLLTDTIQMALSELAEEENHLRQVIFRLQS